MTQSQGVCPPVNALILIAGVSVSFCPFGWSQQDITEADSDIPQFGGPTSVGGQVNADIEKKVSLYRFEGLSEQIEPYYDFKQRLSDEHHFSFGADYNVLFQNASKSLQEDSAAGGVLRAYGTWTLVGNETSDTGALIFKIENRHGLGAGIAPQQLGGELGYAGLTAIPYSDAGTILSNLYWQQSIDGNRVGFVAGIIDVTDYVAVYGMGNPWTDFSNLAFSTDPTIPVPNQGLGAAVRASFSENYYVLAGFADANGEPSKPQDSFDSFMNDQEYFKHLEIGWMSSFKNRFTDNMHLTLWQVDERESAQVNDGWGAAFSVSQKLNERWLPFFKVGYADGGGGLLKRSLSTGIGYFSGKSNDVVGVGVNWGQASEHALSDGDELGDQYTVEVFYRLQVFPHLTITPDIQLLVNPAHNQNDDSLWVFGLRSRLSF